VQVIVLPIADRHHDYARLIAADLSAKGFRVSVDDRNEKTGYKVREAQVQKIPYMLVVGDREVEQENVAVRSRDRGDLGPRPLEEFVRDLERELTAS